MIPTTVRNMPRPYTSALAFFGLLCLCQVIYSHVASDISLAKVVPQAHFKSQSSLPYRNATLRQILRFQNFSFDFVQQPSI